MKKIFTVAATIALLLTGCNQSEQNKKTTVEDSNKSDMKSEKSPLAQAMEKAGYQSPQLIGATEANTQTQKANEELLKKFFADVNSKDTYDSLLKFFDKNIKKMSSEGYYNSLQINAFMQTSSGGGNEREFIQDVSSAFSKYKQLSDKNRRLVKDLVQIELERKGFKVTRGQSDWDNNIHMIIAW